MRAIAALSHFSLPRPPSPEATSGRAGGGAAGHFGLAGFPAGAAEATAIGGAAGARRDSSLVA